jgi:hypothetical protein
MHDLVLIELCCAYIIPLPIAITFLRALIVSAPLTSSIGIHLKYFVLNIFCVSFAIFKSSVTAFTIVILFLKTSSAKEGPIKVTNPLVFPLIN